jgi:hypothetical protein
VNAAAAFSNACADAVYAGVVTCQGNFGSPARLARDGLDFDDASSDLGNHIGEEMGDAVVFDGHGFRPFAFTRPRTQMRQIPYSVQWQYEMVSRVFFAVYTWQQRAS